MVRNPNSTQSAPVGSGRFKALANHFSFTIETISMARIPTAISQFRIIRICRTTWATGKVGDFWIDILYSLSTNDMLFIDIRQVLYRYSIIGGALWWETTRCC